jgi:hypothetical protein
MAGYLHRGNEYPGMPTTQINNEVLLERKWEPNEKLFNFYESVIWGLRIPD